MKLIKDSYYAGIGSRQTPDEIKTLITRIAIKLSEKGLILRSGGADGADEAFQKGVEIAKGKMEIYLPWNGFNNLSNGFGQAILVQDKASRGRAEILAAQFHPAYNSLSQGGKRLMQRNTYQVLGAKIDYSPASSFILCWTKDGADGTTVPVTQGTGGTGQAIRIGTHYGITIRNLRNASTLKKWSEWIEKS